MDRQMVYPGALPQDTDLLLTNKNAMVALGNALQMALGTTTQVDGLACVPTGPATLTVNVGPGSIITQANVDATAYGSIASDTTDNVMKQGIILTTTNFSTPAPITVGQSVVYLVQATFSEIDGGSTVLPYFNASNPASPYNGPNNTGTSNNTVRQGKCVLALKTGVAAATGSQATPTPDAGYTGLYAITVANGQSTVTSGNISTYSGAPILLEKLKDKISQSTGDARYLLSSNQTSWEATDTGAANVYAATLSPAPTAYSAGQRVSLLIAHANTGASTLNLNSLGTKAIKKLSSSGTLVDPASGDIPANVLVDMEYDGTVFEIIGRLAPSATSNTSYGSTAGGTTAYTITTSPAFAALSTGQIIYATINATNTGAVTLNPNSVGVTTVTDEFGNALGANSLLANRTYALVYDGANLRAMKNATGPAYGATAGGTTVYTVTTNPSISNLNVGQVIEATMNATNTGATTLNVNGIGATTVTDASGAALISGSLQSGKTYLLVYDGTNLRVLTQTMTLPIVTVKRQVITSSGTYTPSTGMLYADIEVLAGGGGGGGVTAGSGANAGGGGAGSYSRLIVSAASVGASKAVTIGAGGTAGTNSGGTGGTGGASSLGSLVTANGGLGGVGSTSGGSSVAGGAGGAVGTGGIMAGANGGNGASLNNSNWTGGGGAGGNSMYGGAGPMVIASTAAGNNATGFGAGGGGAGSAGAAANLGGTGSAGVIIITEFCSQ